VAPPAKRSAKRSFASSWDRLRRLRASFERIDSGDGALLYSIRTLNQRSTRANGRSRSGGAKVVLWGYSGPRITAGTFDEFRLGPHSRSTICPFEPFLTFVAEAIAWRVYDFTYHGNESHHNGLGMGWTVWPLRCSREMIHWQVRSHRAAIISACIEAMT